MVTQTANKARVRRQKMSIWVGEGINLNTTQEASNVNQIDRPHVPKHWGKKRIQRTGTKNGLL